MDDDWDLHAVVKGCSTATKTSTTTTAVNTSTHDAGPFPSFMSSDNSYMPFHGGDLVSSSFDDFPAAGLIIDEGNDPFQGLQEIYQELCVDSPQPDNTSAADITAAAITISTPAAQVFHQETTKVQPSLQMNIQENMQLRNSNPSLVFSPMANSQPIRPRRRKNQQMKMVRQMTQEELSADSWAWRKYGQKPIKGSPYPRNYYRCSTSKGCAARKQVERSPNDPGIFVVSYAGEHTHPRPTHRSSLSGSTRNKFSSTKCNINNMNMPQHKGTNSIMSSSSAASGSSFSPTTPLIEGEVVGQNEDVEMVEEDDSLDVGGDDQSEDNINAGMIIPNDLMNDDEDMFKGFQDSDDHSRCGGDFFPSGSLSSPPWTPTSFAASFNGVGGDHE